MTLQQLHDAQEEMGEQEQARRREECQASGGCEATLATVTSGGAKDYCTHCLTLYRHGYAS